MLCIWMESKDDWVMCFDSDNCFEKSSGCWVSYRCNFGNNFNWFSNFNYISLYIFINNVYCFVVFNVVLNIFCCEDVFNIFIFV